MIRSKDKVSDCQTYLIGKDVHSGGRVEGGRGRGERKGKGRGKEGEGDEVVGWKEASRFEFRERRGREGRRRSVTTEKSSADPRVRLFGARDRM